MEITLESSFIEGMTLRKWVCQLVIRSSIVHRTVDNTHRIRPLVHLTLIRGKIGIFNPSNQYRNSRRDENNSKIGEQKSRVISNFFNKKVTCESHKDAHWNCNAAQLDHECIKCIHLLRSYFSALEVGFRSLSRILIPPKGKEPPVPKRSQHHMGQKEKKQVPCSTKDAETHERRNINASIVIKFHLDLRNFFQRSFDRCIGCISHLFHPFMINFTTKYLMQMKIIQSLTQQNHRCVTLLTTSKEQNS
jgi:hypothetical protein